MWYLYSAEIGRCKEYDATSGYGYHNYFKLDEMRVGSAHSDLVNIKLFVLAAKDAHILLSPIVAPNSTTPVYEIGRLRGSYQWMLVISHLSALLAILVLGAGGNTFAEIRRRRQSNSMKTIRTRKLLSSIEPLPIRIRISHDGVIDVSVPGSDLLNLTATDPSPVPVKFISFCTWGTTEAKFFYDCTVDEKKQDAEEEENYLTEQLTPQEHLRANLFSSDDAKTMPSDLKEILFELQLVTASYDYRKSVLTTRAILRTVSCWMVFSQCAVGVF